MSQEWIRVLAIVLTVIGTNYKTHKDIVVCPLLTGPLKPERTRQRF